VLTRAPADEVERNPRWSEWNGRFRDDVRRFVRGDPGIVGAVATRIAGSSDLYQPEDASEPGREPPVPDQRAYTAAGRSAVVLVSAPIPSPA
jgi:hypothetical protein